MTCKNEQNHLNFNMKSYYNSYDTEIHQPTRREEKVGIQNNNMLYMINDNRSSLFFVKSVFSL